LVYQIDSKRLWEYSNEPYSIFALFYLSSATTVRALLDTPKLQILLSREKETVCLQNLAIFHLFHSIDLLVYLLNSFLTIPLTGSVSVDDTILLGKQSAFLISHVL